ncbi:hypothetical protein [Commensalibacter melissae]|nr:hypothetical protein [Commensalibacter melissae]
MEKDHFMQMEEFITYCQAGRSISTNEKELMQLLYQCAFEAQKIIMELNK